MNASWDPVAVLPKLDPAGAVADQPLDPRAALDLQAALHRPSDRAARPDRRTGSRRSWVAVAVAAALAVTATLIGLPTLVGGGADLAFATPRLLPYESGAGTPAEAGLTAIQRKTANLQDPAGSTGEHLVRTESWSLSNRVVNGKTVESAVVPELRELQWTSDGSGHLRVETGAPQFPNQDYEHAWRKDGRPAGTTTVIADESYGPGDFTPMYPTDLSTNPEQLLTQLEVGHPAENGTAGLFGALRDLNLEQAPPPSVRAATLQLLAERSDIVDLGTGKDRAGRDGHVFATDSSYSGLPTRYILIFDPDSGDLLATEEILTKRAGKLDVPIPSVISYTTFLGTR